MQRRIYWSTTRLWKRNILLCSIFILITLLTLSGLTLKKGIIKGESKLMSKATSVVRIKSNLGAGQYREDMVIVNDSLFNTIKKNKNVKSYNCDVTDNVGSNLKVFGKESPDDTIDFFKGGSYKVPNHLVQSVNDPNLNADFSSKISKLEKGRFPQKRNEVLISKNLAEKNKLKVGDVIDISHEDVITHKKDTLKVVITGLFSIKNSDRETNVRKSYNKLNCIYMMSEDIIRLRNLYTKDGPIKGVQIDNIIVNLKPGVSTTEFIKSLQKDGRDYSAVSFSGTESAKENFENSIKNTKKMSDITIFGSLIISFAILSLIMIISFKERKKEFGILMSMGISNVKLFIQNMLEILIILAVSFIISVGVFSPVISRSSDGYIEKQIVSVINESDENESSVGNAKLNTSLFDKGNILLSATFISMATITSVGLISSFALRKENIKELIASDKR